MDINLNVRFVADSRVLVLLNALTGKLEKVMSTQAELLQALQDTKAQLDKAAAEIVAKIAALEAAVAAGGNTTPAVDAALADLKTAAQVLDDIDPTQ